MLFSVAEPGLQEQNGFTVECGVAGMPTVWVASWGCGKPVLALDAKAFLERAGVFKDADVALFTHVSNNFGVSWGQSGSNGMVSAQFRFRGETAHSAGTPWRGRSALDAVM
ncbi:MAG: hypothetical protein L0271_24145, partial [Gemmatimonadetes bacterium]|nr:hypothetical protein [Gemmatimonadota bacterium]